MLCAQNGCCVPQWGGDFVRRHPATGDTVLHMASARGHLHILTFLLDHIKVTATTPTMTLTQQADAMVNALNLAKKTPLIVAAEKGEHRNYLCD